MAACGSAAAGGPRITLEGGCFVLRGADPPLEQWRSAFAVTVEGNPTPLLGSVRVDAGALIFEPRFPLQPGLKYVASFRTSTPVRAVIDIPAAERMPPRVTAIYPSTDRLPENQLKIYLHFSAPMSRGEAYRRIHLLDEHGAPIELPFLEIDQELWDPEGRRLTLLFDPGRIKRGLVPNHDVGPPLHAGHQYTLAIDAGWPDAAATPSEAAFRKDFAVVAADREPPEPSQWKITPPKAGTREPLVIRFPESMDHALLSSLLAVDSVAGQAEVDDAETLWRFTPAAPWKPGRHVLTLDTALEDLAGNRIGRAFDVEFSQHVQRDARHEIRRISFHVR